ncbi:hypothetical protein N7493_010010 [Penicillium malachiteum]|uniref:AB hydrolase-1 domain-containing protein n=1 Tax=Penicillium malachiteum TaxID=1324776 RepID=A0AAD6MS42_9EURO|nr:hypothetical protein N7493_010010 [Penicillium malachiteum]
METAEAPVFVFIPGAWHRPECFDRIRALLTDRGYDSEAVTISVDAASPNIGLHADIDLTKDIIRRSVCQGRRVVVVCHSYSELVGASAVEGLGYAQRSKMSLSGGVVMIIWMSAFVALKGQSIIDVGEGKSDPWVVDHGDGFCSTSEQETVFYNDLPSDEQQKWISKLASHSVLSCLEPALYEPWHIMPSIYIFCTKDNAFSLPFQEKLAKRLGNPGTFRCESSHSPF